MTSIEQKFVEFENKFEQLRSELASLKVGSEDVGIDIEALKESFKTGTGKGEIQSKISTIALHLASDEKLLSVKAIKIMNEMKNLLKIYSALGAHPQKLVYTDDIEAIAYLYYKLKKIISGGKIRPEKEFWEELLNYIHDQTIIDEFKEVGKTSINLDSLEKLIKTLKNEDEIRKRTINAIADFFFSLRALLSENPYDPVYKRIMERLEKLRLEWVTRTINTKTFLAKLKAYYDEANEYRTKLSKMLGVERILEPISHYIKNETGVEVQLNSTSKILNDILHNRKLKRFTDTLKGNVRTELLKDLFRAGIDENLAESLAYKLTDSYLINALEKAWKG
jgi:type I restriction enzyme R subunit